MSDYPRFSLAAGLIASLASGSCYRADIRLLDYTMPRKAEYTLPFLCDKPTSGDLARLVDDASATGFLDGSYVSSLQGRDFYLRFDKGARGEGSYHIKDKSIRVVSGFLPKEVEPGIKERSLRGFLLLRLLFHELGHDYFVNVMSNDDVNRFCTAFRQVHNDYESLRYLELLSDGDEVLPGLFSKFGFTKEAYYAMKGYANRKESLQKEYGKDFDILFNYGPEAYADLMTAELTNKLMAFNELIADRDNPGRFTGEEMIRARSQLSGLSCIPESLRPFYRGFLNEQFFDENMDLDSFIEGKRLSMR